MQFAEDYAFRDRTGGDASGSAVGIGRREALASWPSEGLGKAEEHYVEIHARSVTIDTACSGSLVLLDIVRRMIRSRETDAAIVVTSNLHLRPDHVIDRGSVGQTHSATARCRTFEEDDDSYVKYEAVNWVIIKRLKDADKNRDPVRAVIRGTASKRCVRPLSRPFFSRLT